MTRSDTLTQLARLDLDRQARAGIPEAVFGAGKSFEQVVAIAAELAARLGRALITRIQSGWGEALAAALPDFAVEIFADARVAVVRNPEHRISQTGARVGLLSAGTADVPVAEEARIAAEQMGCEVFCFYDVGVAGVHRLVEPLERICQAEVGAVVVVAGMDGALPTVVKGLVAIPVIGVPTSVGYGYGGGGEAALMSMLQSCSPGLTVVNIDNGFGAGATAGLIANRLTRAARTARVSGADQDTGEGDASGA